jgi:hypothetical protein
VRNQSSFGNKKMAHFFAGGFFEYFGYFFYNTGLPGGALT